MACRIRCRIGDRGKRHAPGSGGPGAWDDARVFAEAESAPHRSLMRCCIKRVIQWRMGFES